MKNQNLNVDIDLTAISQAIRAGYVKPNKYVDRNGIEHQTICLMVMETKTPTDNKTHNVKIKAPDAWKEAKDKDGNTIFCGKACPSKYQPRDNSQHADQQSQAQSFEDIF